jgi:hypothetical protein
VRLGQEVQEVPRRLGVVHFNRPNLDKRLVDSGLVDFEVAPIDQA